MAVQELSPQPKTVISLLSSEIIFDNVAIDLDSIIAIGDEAQKLFQDSINLGTLCIGAEAVGCMTSCYLKTVEYTKTREQFEQPISNFQWAGTVATNGIGTDVIESEPPLQNFDVSWRPGTERIIIVFSDEYPQSFLVPKLNLEEVKNDLKHLTDYAIRYFKQILKSIKTKKIKHIKDK